MGDDEKILATVDRQPPYNLEAEQAVLGSIMISSEALLKCVEFLEESMFYKTGHQKIYSAILTLYEDDVNPDYLTVCDQLERDRCLEEVGGAYYVTQLAESIPAAESVMDYAKIVQKKHFLRRLILGASRVQMDAYDEKPIGEILMEFQDDIIYKITDEQASNDFMNMSVSLETSLNTMDKIVRNSKDGIIGVPSGYSDFDLMTGGFQYSELVYLAGQPSKGKTAFGMNVAINAAKAGYPVGVSSYEMSLYQLVVRMLCTEAEIDLHLLRTGKADDSVWKKITEAVSVLSELPIYINDSQLNLLQLKTKIEKLKREKGILFHLIDYVQLIPMPGRYEQLNRDRQVTKISNTLKATAKKLNIALMGISTLNRSEAGKRPSLWSLRESGSLEYDADMVLFVHDPMDTEPGEERNKNVRELIIAKQRNGPTGTVRLRCENKYTKFFPLEENREEDKNYWNPSNEEAPF